LNYVFLNSSQVLKINSLSSKCHITLPGIQKALKRKANFEESKKFKEQLQAYKREIAERNEE
jgi:hypothetical protein